MDINKTILEVNHLITAFQSESGGTLKAVNDVSFSLHEGEILGLVGESGSGKSVTAFSIMGLLPAKTSRIEQGEILFAGQNLLKYSARQMSDIRGREMCMIFQEPMTSLNPVLTIGNQMAEVFTNHTKMSSKSIRDESIALLKRVGIARPAQLLTEYPHQLSGGMRQRVMIAMAIALKPKILIADEPTTALDVTIQAQILDLLKGLSEEYGIAILFITHNLSVVAELCDNVLVMYSGQIVEKATVEQLFEAPRHPYTQCLLKCIPQLGMSGQPLHYIRGTVTHPGDAMPGCRFESRCEMSFADCAQIKPELYPCGDDQYARCLLCRGDATDAAGRGQESRV